MGNKYTVGKSPSLLEFHHGSSEASLTAGMNAASSLNIFSYGDENCPQSLPISPISTFSYPKIGKCNFRVCVSPTSSQGNAARRYHITWVLFWSLFIIACNLFQASFKVSSTQQGLSASHQLFSAFNNSAFAFVAVECLTLHSSSKAQRAGLLHRNHPEDTVSVAPLRYGGDRNVFGYKRIAAAGIPSQPVSKDGKRTSSGLRGSEIFSSNDNEESTLKREGIMPSSTRDFAGKLEAFLPGGDSLTLGRHGLGIGNKEVYGASFIFTPLGGLGEAVKPVCERAFDGHAAHRFKANFGGRREKFSQNHQFFPSQGGLTHVFASAGSMLDSTSCASLKMRALKPSSKRSFRGISVDVHLSPFTSDSFESFVIDSGAQHTAISAELLERMEKISWVNDLKNKVFVRAKLGDISVSFEAEVLPSFSGRVPYGAAGILGLDFLKKFDLIDFNFEEANINLFPNIQDIPSDKLQSFYEAAVCVPLTQLSETTLLGVDTTIQLPAGNSLSKEGGAVAVECAGVLDFGSEHSLANSALLEEMKRSGKFAHIVQEGEKMEVSNLRNGSVIVAQRLPQVDILIKDSHGRREVLAPNVSLYHGDLNFLEEVGLKSTTPTLILGMDTLAKNRLLIDFKRNLLHLQGPHVESGSVAEDAKKREVDAGKGHSVILKDKEEEIRSDLMAGRVKFSALKEELEGKNVSISDCKTIDEIISKVAALRIFGDSVFSSSADKNSVNEGVKGERSSSVPLEQAYSKKLEQLTKEFSSLDSTKKQSLLEKIESSLGMSSSNEKLSKDSSGFLDVLKKYAKYLVYGSNSNDTSKSETKPKEAECSAQASVPSVQLYSEEVKKLRKDYDEASGIKQSSVISAYKAELEKKGVDYSDCSTSAEVINRLAYARVFTPQIDTSSKENQEKPKKVPVKATANANSKKDYRKKNGGNRVGRFFIGGGGGGELGDGISASSPFMFDSPFDSIFEEFFGASSPLGLFGNVSNIINPGGGSNGRSNIITIHLNNKEGDEAFSEEDFEDGTKFQQDQQLDFKQEGGAGKGRKSKKGVNGNETVSEEALPSFEAVMDKETNPQLRNLLQKAKACEDSGALPFLMNSLQDPSLRNLLLKVCATGKVLKVDGLLKECQASGNLKGLYMLQKLSDLSLV